MCRPYLGPEEMNPGPVLTIAGSDSGGGAGLQQDLKVFTVLGAYGSSVVTALTAQNTLGVQAVEPVDPDFVGKQLNTVLEDIRPVAIKTGMLANAAIVEIVADCLDRHAGEDAIIVADPVMISKSGYRLLEQDAVDVLMGRLLPVADVFTPNIPEAEVLLGRRIQTPEDMRLAATDLLKHANCPSVILKGGHLHAQDPVDILAREEGVIEITGKRISTQHTHGTGCTFSAALLVFLARGLGMENAARKAKEFVTRAIRGAIPVGKGIGPTNPLSVIEDDVARYPVIEALEKAWKHLLSFPCRSLVPEVQMNLGYALPWAGSVQDVAAFPGRIVALEEGVARIRGPVYGASSHVARIILTAMGHDRAYRSAMNIRYDLGYLKRAQDLGYSMAEFSRKDEPEEVKAREGSTLVWGVRRAIERVGMVPDIIHDAGDIGKEPIIRVLGHDPLEVVDKALRLADFL
ncbi:MAG: bifunctional hydroxymethylpyrimidine kinase/phosphomethylpyrimidine kinase [Deltaproteobacteria bacterium]|nr:bifunctional hydroxymethylpyrimidine kinase/phosphomethylpyrimidine kinase [Deltaproteobacteria bacterium]MDL1962098.1 bifunctional hydroxymethylpyrimidine kinase/phosphomethylpyrimidine kinase [Deltaproteobacteria bacterium]